MKAGETYYYSIYLEAGEFVFIKAMQYNLSIMQRLLPPVANIQKCLILQQANAILLAACRKKEISHKPFSIIILLWLYGKNWMIRTK